MDLELRYLVRPDGGRTLTIPDERRAAAIAYVRDHAARPAAEIEALVQEGHDELLRDLAAIPEGDATRAPAQGEWSALDLMAHVVSTKRIVATLARALASGTLPPGFGNHLENESAQDGVTFATFPSLAEAREAAEAAHQGLLELIATLDGAVDTDTRFRHFVFGAFNCREWAVFQRIHDGDHAPQLRRIRDSLAQPAT